MSEENTKKSKGRGDASPLKDPAVRAKAREASSKSWTPERRAKAAERMKIVHSMRKNPPKIENLIPGTKELVDKARIEASKALKNASKAVWESQAVMLDADLEAFSQAIKKNSTNGRVALDLLKQGVTYADIANTMKTFADQGLLPLAVYFKTGQHYGLPYLTSCHLRTWAKNHPEIKEAMQYCNDRALLSNLEQLKRGAKLDTIKYINNICLRVFETSQIKADVSGSLEVKGEIQVKAVSLGDLRHQKNKE